VRERPFGAASLCPSNGLPEPGTAVDVSNAISADSSLLADCSGATINVALLGTTADQDTTSRQFRLHPDSPRERPSGRSLFCPQRCDAVMVGSTPGTWRPPREPFLLRTSSSFVASAGWLAIRADPNSRDAARAWSRKAPFSLVSGMSLYRNLNQALRRSQPPSLEWLRYLLRDVAQPG
jgi:hypothetical protein